VEAVMGMIKNMTHFRSVFMMLHLIFIAAISTFSTGCSYAMDMLEGVITERASFSIEASYDSSSHRLNVSWEETGDSSGFAGFEVYMTTSPWDEYGDYKVVAASENLSPSLPSWITFRTDSGLSSRYADSTYILVNPPVEAGEYYVRVGMVKFDEKDDSSGGGYYGSVMPGDYIDHTTLDAVSGYEAVYIE
jgi:hypothetical protein